MMRLKKRFLFPGLILLCVFASCKNYYKAINTPKTSKAAHFDSLKTQSRYFILRSGDQAFHMTNIVLSDDQKTVSVTLDTLSADHKLHLVNGRNGKQQYKKYNDLDLGVLNEVHFYTPPLQAKPGKKFQLNLD